MSGSERPITPSHPGLSVAWLRQELGAHGPQVAPPEASVDASLEGLANPPVDGVAASFAMLDAFQATEALNELRVSRDALLDAYAGLARAFDAEAADATVFDDCWRDARQAARRVAAGRSFSAEFRNVTDEACAMAAVCAPSRGARLFRGPRRGRPRGRLLAGHPPPR